MTYQKYGFARAISVQSYRCKQEQRLLVEFTTLDGESIAIVTLAANQVRPSKPREIAHVRDLTANP